MLHWPSTTKRRNKQNEKSPPTSKSPTDFCKNTGMFSQGHRGANICSSSKPKPWSCLLFFTPQICTDAQRDPRMRRRRHKGQDGNIKGTQSHPHPSTHKLLQVRSCSLHDEGWKIKIFRTLSLLRGLCPPGLSLNLAGSKGWEPGQALSALTPHHLELWKTQYHTPDPPCQCYRGLVVMLLLPQRFFCLDFLPQAKAVPKTPKQVSGALLGRQSQPPQLSPPSPQAAPHGWTQPLSSPGSASGLQDPGNELLGAPCRPGVCHCHKHKDLHQQGQLEAATTQPQSLGFP